MQEHLLKSKRSILVRLVRIVCYFRAGAFRPYRDEREKESEADL